MKLIKFDLPIDGTKVKTLDELQEHFTIEVLEHFRTGLLQRWLRSRGILDELVQVEKMDVADDFAALKMLCQILGIDVDDLILSTALSKGSVHAEVNLKSFSESYVKLANSIDFVIWASLFSKFFDKSRSPTLTEIYDILLKRIELIESEIILKTDITPLISALQSRVTTLKIISQKIKAWIDSHQDIDIIQKLQQNEVELMSFSEATITDISMPKPSEEKLPEIEISQKTAWPFPK